MKFEEVNETALALEIEFDSHAFIRKFVEKYPKSYGELLVKHENVTTANAEIANYLRNNSNDLHVTKIKEDHISADILGNDAKNSLWRKEENQ